MNKLRYRVIFSKLKQCLVVVSELVKSAGKGTDKTAVQTPQVFSKTSPKSTAVELAFSQLSLQCYGLFGLLFIATSSWAHAALMIQTDPQASAKQQAVVLATANGIPQVNIQTPNQQGLSYNRYAQFDVDKQGAILNNSRKETQTQLGGWIQANPYLLGGEAKLIVNEVNSSKPSQLKGYIEVAGKKADVVIANPSGLHCEGCGIINAQRATFTTGKPQIQQGHLESFVVEKGKIHISGKGLDNSQTDYTDILARQAEINAGIWSKKAIAVTTGQNKISPNNQKIEALPAKSTQNPPQFALDVAQLGGMYAEQIHLIGTEQGLGIGNAGHIGASAGNVQIDINGNLHNTGFIGASENLQLQSQQQIQNRAQLFGKKQTQLKSASLDNQQGQILAQNMHIEAQQINNQQGIIHAQAQLNLQAKSLLDEGHISSSGNAQIALQQGLTLRNGFKVKGNLDFSTQGKFSNQSTLNIGNQLNLQAAEVENLPQGEISAKTNQISTAVLTNQGLIDGKQTRIFSQQLNNLGTGRIYGDHLSIQAHRINNLEQTIENETKSAVLAARARMDLAAEELLNRDGSHIISLGSIHFGNLLDQHHQATGYANKLENSNALIEAQGDIVLKAHALKNAHKYLATEIREVSRTPIYEYRPANGSERFAKGTAGLRVVKEGNSGGGGLFGNAKVRDLYSLYLPDGSKHQNWVEYDYTRVIRESQVLPPAYAEGRILSAGNIDFAASNIENLDSKILAAGDILIENADSLLNHETKGVKLSKDHGQAIYKTKGRKCVRRILGKCVDRADTTNTWKTRYSPPEVSETLSLGVWDYAAHAAERIHNLQDAEHKTISPPPAANSSELEYHSAQYLQLSTSSLYKLNPDPHSHYLIETDPRFVDRKQWLSSDYMYDQLRASHANVHKRLGDGYYEQRLINEQIHQLTGRRLLEGYQSDFEQYKALMDSGKLVAEKFNLSLGVGLTAQQMQQLTTDMVWLVHKDVQIQGKTYRTLVPQVYLSPRNVQLTQRGALISANQIIAKVKGEISNSGSISSQKITALEGKNLHNNAGIIAGDQIILQAQQDLKNLAGKLLAKNQLLAQANNISFETSLTESAPSADFAHKKVDQRSTAQVRSKDGNLILLAKENISLKGVELESAGDLQLRAQQLNLDSIETHYKEQLDFSAGNYAHLSQRQQQGNRLNAKGNASLVGKTAVKIQGDLIHADKSLLIASTGDIQIQPARQQEKIAMGTQSETKGLLSSEKIVNKHEHDYDLANASQIDGEKVTIVSEKGKLDIQGAQIVAEQDLHLAAQNIQIREAENRIFQQDFQSVRKSGLLTGGGKIGFTIGSQKQSLESDQTKHYAQESQLGSLNGNINIQAHKHYEQTASSLTAVAGDVKIQSEKVDILAADDKYETNSKQTFEQKGLTVALSVPLMQALQAGVENVKAVQKVGESNNKRINALAAANATWETLRTAETIGKAMDATQALANGDMQNAGLSVSISYGQQKNVQSTHTSGTTANSSNINAGNAVNIMAKGAGERSDINVVGSNIIGKKSTALAAEDEINLLAKQQTHKERSQNKSSGWNAGVAISYGQNGFAFGITAGGNYGKGYGNGDENSWLASRVGSLQSHTAVYSQADTHIKGAQLLGEAVKLKAQNLNIESLQDSMTYKGKQMNVSGQVTVGYGFSASGSYNQSKLNANYASVNTQAGIFAGDSGFDVAVKQHTDLTGALITSTTSAENAGKNRFSTGTVRHSDIQNHADYRGSGFGLSGGVSLSGGESAKKIGDANLMTIANNQPDGSSKVEFSGVAGIGSQGNWGIAKGLATALIGRVSEKSSEKNLTTSAIHTANIKIQNSKAQHALTGKTAAQTAQALNRENTHRPLDKIDISKVRSNLAQDLEIAEEFVGHLSSRGDDIYYDMEKNQDEVFVIQHEAKKRNCDHISCLGFDDGSFKDNSQALKAIIYSDKLLTDEQARLLSKVATAGMLNLERKEKVSSAILYDKDLNSINETAVILNRGSSGIVNEFLFTGFERFRAWANIPSLFGASNATRTHAQINKKLEEYNAHRIAQGKPTIEANNIAHSLGVSGNKNMLNWSEYVGNKYENTKINFMHLGGSYPSEEINKQAKNSFKEVSTQYVGVEGDFVYSGIGGYFIGNNKNATKSEKLSFFDAHSAANQNINNLKYIYNPNNEKGRKKEEETKEILNKLYPFGIRRLNNTNEESK